jgi:hypothetical protein
VRPISPVRQVSSFFNNRANEILPPYRRNFLQISLPSYIRDLPIFNVDNSPAELQGGSQEEGELEAEGGSMEEAGEVVEAEEGEEEAGEDAEELAEGEGE